MEGGAGIISFDTPPPSRLFSPLVCVTHLTDPEKKKQKSFRNFRDTEGGESSS